MSPLMIAYGMAVLTVIGTIAAVLAMNREQRLAAGYLREVSKELGWAYSETSRIGGQNPSISGTTNGVTITVKIRGQAMSGGGMRWFTDYSAWLSAPANSMNISAERQRAVAKFKSRFTNSEIAGPHLTATRNSAVRSVADLRQSIVVLVDAGRALDPGSNFGSP